MTANELAALLGRSWGPLLVYPGGITVFALAWLLGWCGWPASRADAGAVAPAVQIVAVAAPWLAVALLPLPYATNGGRPIDAVVLLALLEWPLLLVLAAQARSPNQANWHAAAQRLAAALNGYPVLLLALLALANSSGSLLLHALARPPADQAPPLAAVLYWFGAGSLLLALPPVVGLGPFAAPAPASGAVLLALRLRLLGYGALAALPWFPLVGGAGVLLPPLIIALLLAGFHRCARGTTRRWASVCTMLAALQLAALLAAAAVAWWSRIS